MKRIVIKVKEEDWIGLQEILFSKGYGWGSKGQELHEYPSDHIKQWCIYLNSFQSYELTQTQFLPNDSRPVYDFKTMDLNIIEGKENFTNIWLATSDTYKLLTNKEGTRFVAGCRDFTRKEAIEHWTHVKETCPTASRADRASLFLSAIHNHIKEVDEPEHIAKYRQMVNDAAIALKEAEEDLEKAIEAEKKKEFKRFKPIENEVYYLVSIEGEVLRRVCGSTGPGSTSDFAYKIGNTYKTRSEAEEAVNRLKAITAINDLIDEVNEEWVPTWGKSNQYKYYIHFSHDGHQLKVSYDCMYQSTSVLKPIRSRGAAESIIKHITDDQIKLIWGVDVSKEKTY